MLKTVKRFGSAALAAQQVAEVIPDMGLPHLSQQRTAEQGFGASPIAQLPSDEAQ